MYSTSVHVMSVNGRVAKDGGDAHSWTSDDDSDHFQNLATQHNLFIMDLETYQAVQPEPQSDRLRIVVTDQAESQISVPGQLEFVNKKPQELVEDLTARGYEKILLVGGAINAAFLQAGLVDEMVVTIEPVVFGGGEPLLDTQGLDIRLRLASIEQLNRRGTLLARYHIDKKDAPRVS